MRECPVCLEEGAANAHWAVFPCGHATCRPCYERLVAKPQQDAACPLCRAPLCEPVPGTRRIWSHVRVYARALPGQCSEIRVLLVPAPSLGSVPLRPRDLPPLLRAPGRQAAAGRRLPALPRAALRARARCAAL